MTDKITQSLINSCKKLYDKKIISYENYLKCTNEMRDKEMYVSDSELKTTYTNARDNLVAEKQSAYKRAETRVNAMIDKIKNNEIINANYTTLVNDLKEEIRKYEENFNGADENKDILYTEMLNRNKELADKTESLNSQLNEIETMSDKNNIIQNKMSHNMMINKIIIAILILSILFIFYKLLSHKPQEIISV